MEKGERGKEGKRERGSWFTGKVQFEGFSSQSFCINAQSRSILHQFTAFPYHKPLEIMLILRGV